MLALGLTGYLLPWDMKALFATKVTMQIIESVPLIGVYLKTLIAGSPDIVGAQTITRFFAIHVFAKGAKESIVLYVHALRNALIPVVTIIGVLIPRLLSGAVITEAIFGWTGIGTLIIEVARGRDYPLVMGVTVMITIVVVVCNLFVEASRI